MVKECIRCHTKFTANWPRQMAKYCQPCRVIIRRERSKNFHQKMAEKINARCIDCGKLLSWHSGNRPPSIRCISCRLKNMSGSNSPSWRGGRKVDKDGYVFIYHPEPHPHRRETSKKRGYRSTYYVAEHILNWEKANNMSLPEGYTVHHLNGIRNDNRPRNLVALTTPRHSSGLVNKALQKRIRELEAMIDQSKFI